VSTRISGVMLAVALAAGLSVGLAGCGGDPASPGAASTATPAGASPSAPFPVGDAGSASASPPAPSAPPTPLTGPVATLDVGTVRLPAGWTVRDGGADWQVALCPPPEKFGAGCVLFSDIHDSSAAAPTPEAIDAQVKVELQTDSYHWTRKPNVTLGGLLFYRLVDDTDENEYDEQYGSLHDGRDVVLTFEFSKILMTPAQRRTFIDAIAGSYQPS
jgi:hypothetical protein